MSTRRTTRAGSRAASNAGASPAPTNLSDIPAAATPSVRRARRSANAGLPAVGLKTSTAYGSAGIVRPARVTGPQGAGQINNVLGGILAPADPNAANPSGGAATPAATQTEQQGAATNPMTNLSFNQESGIFGNADIHSSPADANDLSNIPEESEFNDLDSNDSDAFPPEVPSPNTMVQQQLEELARANAQRNAGRTGPGSPPTVRPPIINPRRIGIPRVNFEVFSDKASRIWNHPYTSWSLFPLGILLLSMVLATLFSPPGTFSWYGPLDIRHNVGQYIPSKVAHPLLPEDALGIRKRLSSIESDIITIKRDLKGVNFKAIHRLEELLPDFLVIKKKNGIRQIPDDFWHALQHKIRSDETLMNEPAPSGKQSSGTGGVIENKVRKIVGDEWAKYMSENEAKLGKFSDEDFVRKFPKLLEENDVVARSDIIDMISQNWDDNSSKIMFEMGHLTKQIERTARDLNKLQQQQGSGKLTEDEIKALAKDVLKLIPDAQLKAAADTNLQNSVNWGLKKVNHFAKFAGAVVEPYLTSPTFVFPSQDVWLPHRWARKLMRNPVPTPASADAALTRWEEYGDCWCSAAVDSQTGYGPSLGVLMGSSIYPEQIVIEHISKSATLQPGAAPREMELLAFVPDPETFKAVKSLSNDLFKDETEETGKLTGYVRIATWTYDVNSNQNVQPFTVQVDMKSLGAHTSRLVVRSKNNWGEGDVPYTCLYRVRVHGEVVIPPAFD